ncbi:hypothetical protein H6778_00095 [Candidatus Nomurabacteria bacterium]|nr:hypothetical protein [Candidatus Nomurabacteria bacterium]
MPTTYSGLVIHIIDIINLMIPALFGVVFVYFIWKMIDAWVLRAGDQSGREEGKQYALAAIIAFVVMITAWGIVSMVKNSLFGS